MEEKWQKEDSTCCRENDERKQPYTHRDIKRKLSLTKKKIDDLQHQRKIAYRNSVKVKRVIHNQVNQIVKCLRSRERYLWSEIDDAYLSQDENINEELLRLQTIYSNCQTLFDQLEDNPQNAKVLSKIYCTLVQVNYDEKLNGRPLEFTSEFETLKTAAADFGNLTGDFYKKDEFVIIDKDCSSNVTSEKICNNRDNIKNSVSEKNNGKEDSSNEYSSTKTDLEDLFEVISFSDNVSSEEFEKDFHMIEQDNFDNGCHQVENVKINNAGKKLKDSNKPEDSQNTLKDKEFNIEEEWKQLFEFKSRISGICGILPKLENGSSGSENQNSTSNNLNAVNKSKEFVYLSPNEVSDWLPKKRARKDEVLNKNTWPTKHLFENRDGLQKRKPQLEKNEAAKSHDRSQTNLRCKLSPAEIVQREFSKYSVKNGIENWLPQHRRK